MMRLGTVAIGFVLSSSLYAADGSVVGDGLADKVVGRYAIRSNLATVQKLPVLGNTNALSSTFSLVDVVRDGEGLKVEEETCRIQLSSSGPVAQSVPDALPQSIGVQSAPFRVWQDGDAVRFVKDPVATILGARLVDPEKDALPTKTTDARVFDQDGDGHPGVTVKVSGGLISGEIYLVQRLKSTWVGTLGADGNLSGLLQDQGEQSIVDASAAVLKGKIAVTIDPDASKSHVRLVRLNEVYDCARLIQEAGALFPAQ